MAREVTDKEWGTFFTILNDIVNLEMSSDERGKLILEKAERAESEGDIEEFAHCIVDAIEYATQEEEEEEEEEEEADE